MGLGHTLNYISHNTKALFADAKRDVESTFRNFKDAPKNEKIWVVLKTLAVAVACGIIALGVGAALTGSFGIAAPVIATVVGGAYAFYKFAGSARPYDALPLQEAVEKAKEANHEVKGGVRELGRDLVKKGNHLAKSIKNWRNKGKEEKVEKIEDKKEKVEDKKVA